MSGREASVHPIPASNKVMFAPLNHVETILKIKIKLSHCTKLDLRIF